MKATISIFFLISFYCSLSSIVIGQTDTPTGITPNGDSTNETWRIRDENSEAIIEVKIFDRWGKVLWKSENYYNNWNGVDQSNNILENGTYYYSISIDDTKSTGWINVIR